MAELTWNTFRNHLIAEYEIPKYEGDLGQPQPLRSPPSQVAARKVELIVRHFPSQAGRSWFRPETFQAVMSLRGVECNAPDGLAEAFHCRKVVDLTASRPRRLSKMRVLVTGHLGYIGVELVPMLRAAGHEVVGLDNGYFDGCDFVAPPDEVPAARRRPARRDAADTSQASTPSATWRPSRTTLWAT